MRFHVQDDVHEHVFYEENFEKETQHSTLLKYMRFSCGF